jgi:hypothetical protein
MPYENCKEYPIQPWPTYQPGWINPNPYSGGFLKPAGKGGKSLTSGPSPLKIGN